MKVSEVLRLLKDDGWVLVRTKGSHRQFKHPTKSGRVTLAGKPVIPFRQVHWRVSSSKRAGINRGEIMKRYAIVVEAAENNFAAYVPDLPGCVATGDTI